MADSDENEYKTIKNEHEKELSDVLDSPDCENYEFSILLEYQIPDLGQTIGCNNGFQYWQTIDDPTTFNWRICHCLFHFTNQSLFFI